MFLLALRNCADSTFDLTYDKTKAEWLEGNLIVSLLGPAADTNNARTQELVLPASSSDLGNGIIAPANATSPYGTATRCSAAG